MILGISLIAVSVVLTAINVLDKYLAAKRYDPLGLGPTAIRLKGHSDPDMRWIAVPDDLSFPSRTGDYVADLLDSEGAELVGRGRTARRAVRDLVERHLKDAEEIDLTR